jgi:hypothetical protein
MATYFNMTATEFPKMNALMGSLPKTMVGHFWVVRDGRIIDPKFPQHKMIQRIQGTTDECCYLPAPEATQRIMISSHAKKARDACGENYAAFFAKVMEGNAKFGFCFLNAVMEQSRNGGEIVFGSAGWVRADGSKFYEFGGPEFSTFADFTGKTDAYAKACQAEFIRSKGRFNPDAYRTTN